MMKPLKTTTTSTAKLLSCESRRVELSVAVLWSEVGGARVSCCVDEIVICVCTAICNTTTSTTHFRSGKVVVIVASVTSLSKMVFDIVCTRVSLGVEVSWRDVLAVFRG